MSGRIGGPLRWAWFVLCCAACQTLPSAPEQARPPLQAVQMVWFDPESLGLLNVPGKFVYLKVSEDSVGQLFLGRFRAGILLPLSVPRSASQLRYEVYNEAGWRTEGHVALSEVVR